MTELQPNGTEGPTDNLGTPVWNDLSAPDAAAARMFYTALFGWDVSITPGEQYGGYGMFLYDGKTVAGVGPTMDRNGPAAWLMYVLTDNAAETTARVAAAGGQVAVSPLAVGTQGTMAIFIDPAGASVGVWQPGIHGGAESMHSLMSVAWNELHSRDMAAVAPFYAAVFGWEAESSPFGDSEYTYWKLDGRGVAGGVPLAPTRPAEMPSHWLAFFAVPNCDDMVARARELGATTLTGPLTSEDGRYCILQDPQGAIFGMISAAPSQNS